jgi:hypothetical protein
VIALLLLLCMPVQAKDILISFDGSQRLDMWEDSLAFAKANQVKFTYFVSAPYFLVNSDLKGHPYWAEKEIGYAPLRPGNRDSMVSARFHFIAQAVEEGHEIASHLCGHYVGTGWTYEQWMKEMEFFKWTFSRPMPHPGHGIDFKHIVGIRAPCLAVNAAFFKAAKDSGYEYDSSTVANGEMDKVEKYITEIPIRRIRVILPKAVLNRLHIEDTLPFDYEFSLRVGAKYMRQIFFDSLCYDYLTGPTPMQICLHFQEYDGDPYYNAMKDFVMWVKDKDPRYITYKEAR